MLILIYVFVFTYIIKFFQRGNFFLPAVCLGTSYMYKKILILNTNMLVPLQVNQLTFLREKILK